MPWDGNGNFNRLYSWQQDAANGIKIRADRMDADTDDITTNGFGDCLTRDGQGSPTTNLTMNGFRLTNVGTGFATGDALALGITTSHQYIATTGGIGLNAPFSTTASTFAGIGFRFFGGGAPVDGRTWQFGCSAPTVVSLTTVSDTDTAGISALSVSRTGLTPTGWTFRGNRYDFANATDNNYQFSVDGTASSVATGILVTGKAAAAGADISVQSSGANENLTINAKGSGSITLNGTGTGAVILRGTSTNDSAASGFVGEIIEATLATGSATALTTGTAKTVTSISLSAGDWDVWGNVGVTLGASTVMTEFSAGISTTANTFATPPSTGAIQICQLPFTTGAGQAITAGKTRISVASTTTVYLIGRATFTVSTCSAYGYIGARRVR